MNRRAILLGALALGACSRSEPCSRTAVATLPTIGARAAARPAAVQPPALTPTEPNYVRTAPDDSSETATPCEDGGDACGAADADPAEPEEGGE